MRLPELVHLVQNLGEVRLQDRIDQEVVAPPRPPEQLPEPAARLRLLDCDDQEVEVHIL